MIEPIKQQAFGLAALQVLEFTPEYSGRWNEAFERLQDDVREGREPGHCSIRDGFEFWSWLEVVAHIERSAERLWKPMETELQAAKERVLCAAVEGNNGQALNVEYVHSLDLKSKHKVLIQALTRAVEEANKDCETVREMFSIRSYSGRGMYGRYCLGLDIPPGKDATPVAIKMGEAFKLLGQGSKDSMGHGSILYWPRIRYY
ncbi:hypothetical protein ACV1DG_23215 [Aeromonas hydrophila]|uniref:hypothetical protein n=1 Tax=Gammaproteobacteria TaxID=1236 RepID=UPI001CC50340|nr:hypothetical protein [Aeromonas caviae]GJA75711.1 hypothetical protein KAM354_09470 [Aeromonas caviae]HDT5888770.1 hypothetical protein [Aeromonas dhakensis]HEB4980795.1 hypothetical protein [Aeromonas dhakensis]HEB5079424.1 hypothetical protein [Aeromonas hydrophila subsp. hydrophila]